MSSRPQDRLMSKSALVTGAAGFLGSYICAALAQAGWTVTGLDRNPAPKGIPSPWTGWEIAELPGPRIAEVVSGLKPDLIVHAAGSASVPNSLAEPAHDFRHSAVAYFDLLDAVRQHSAKSVVLLLSSAAVYGNPASLPISEDDRCRPLSPYGFHKLICEGLNTEFHDVYAIGTCSARIFSAYGEGLDRQVLWDICQKAVSSKSMTLFGTGAESRDFINAEDVADAIVAIAENADFAGESYNLASGSETTISELAHALIAELGTQSQVAFTGETRPGDPLRWRADTSRLRALGFEPKVVLADGLRDYASWYLEQRPLS